MLQRLLDRVFDGDAVLFAQDRNFSVLDEFIRPADSLHWNMDIDVVQVLHDGGTEAVYNFAESTSTIAGSAASQEPVCSSCSFGRCCRRWMFCC